MRVLNGIEIQHQGFSGRLYSLFTRRVCWADHYIVMSSFLKAPPIRTLWWFLIDAAYWLTLPKRIFLNGMNCQTWTFHWTSYAIALPAIGLRSLWMMPAGQLEQPCGAQLAMLPAPLLETCCVWVTYMLKVIISYWWWCVTALQSMAVKRNLLLLSNSTLHGSGYLEYASDHIQQFLRGCGVTEVPRFTWGSQLTSTIKAGRVTPIQFN